MQAVVPQSRSEPTDPGLFEPSLAVKKAKRSLGKSYLALYASDDAKRHAVWVTEIKFRKVAVQVLFLAMLIYAFHAALEN